MDDVSDEIYQIMDSTVYISDEKVFPKTTMTADKQLQQPPKQQRKQGPPNVTWPPPGHHGPSGPFDQCDPLALDSPSGSPSLMCPPSPHTITATTQQLQEQPEQQSPPNVITWPPPGYHGPSGSPSEHSSQIKEMKMKNQAHQLIPQRSQQPPLAQPDRMPNSTIIMVQNQNNVGQKQAMEVKVSRIKL